MFGNMLCIFRYPNDNIDQTYYDLPLQTQTGKSGCIDFDRYSNSGSNQKRRCLEIL